VFREPVDVWAATFLDSGNVLPAAALAGIVDGATSHFLLPRQCLSFTELHDSKQVELTVIDCIYLEERYEILGELAGHKVRFYSEHRAETGPNQSAWVQTSGVLGLNA
jgi:hypothetical protein